jgi:hypothetical protein
LRAANDRGAIGPRRNRPVVIVVLVGLLGAAGGLVALCVVSAYLVGTGIARRAPAEPQPGQPIGPDENSPERAGVEADPGGSGGDPYATNWRHDFDRPDRAALLVKAAVAADELRKAGVQLHDGFVLTATPEPKHFTADGQFRPEILQAMRVAGIDALTLRGGQGGVPFGDAGMRQLDRLRCLYEIDIQQCDVTDDGLAGLSALKSLAYVEISGAKDKPLRLTGKGFVHFRAARELTRVNVDAACLGDDGLKALGEHPTIHSLWLAGNKITDVGIAHLHRCQELTSMYLNENPITGAGFRGLFPQTLDILSLRSCPVTDDGAAAIAGLRVRELTLGSDKLTDVGGAALAKTALLRRLDLSDAPIGDRTLRALAASPTLQVLELSDARVTDAGLLALAAAPRLKQVMIYKCPKVTAAGVAKLKAVKPGLVVQFRE